MPCLVLALGLGAGPGLAETPPAAMFHSLMEETQRVLADEPRFRRLSRLTKRPRSIFCPPTPFTGTVSQDLNL
jgi:hypothetical protein